MTAEQWISKISSALGRRFPETDRIRFAKTVLGELPYRIRFGKETASLNDNLPELQTSSRKALKAIRRFHKAVTGSFEGQVIDSFVRVQLQSEPASAIDLEAIENYLSVYSDEASSKQAPSRKRGPNNLAVVSIATMVAAQYAKHFRQNPGHATGMKRMNKRGGETRFADTPFDRVCNVIESLLQKSGTRISLTGPARAEAVRIIKERGPLVE